MMAFMIPVVSRSSAASPSCRPRPVSLAVMNRRTDEHAFPVMVYAAVVAAPPGLRGFGGMVLKPHQILGYLADCEV
jgi:hypothetical protein